MGYGARREEDIFRWLLENTWLASQPVQPAGQRSQPASTASQPSQLLYLIINILRGHHFVARLEENVGSTFMRMYHKSWPSGRCGLRAVRAERTLTDKTQENYSSGAPQSASRTAAGLVLVLAL